MNNRKGEIDIGVLILVFVGVIVGLAILVPSVSTSVAQLTKTFDITNKSYTFPVNGGNLTLEGQATSNVIVINATSGAVVPSSNYTIRNKVVVNGQLDSILEGESSGYSGTAVNVSYTYEPEGYQGDSGSRAIMNLVIVFAALAIAVVALIPSLRSELVDMIS